MAVAVWRWQWRWRTAVVSVSVAGLCGGSGYNDGGCGYDDGDVFGGGLAATAAAMVVAFLASPLETAW